MTNYYDVLGVARDASESEVRDKFRVLAREIPPGSVSGPARRSEAEERFQLLTEAMNVLTSPARRKAHDLELEKNRPVSQDPAAQARVYLAKGVKAYREGNFPDAIPQFELSVKHYDKDAKAQHYLALACMKVDRAGAPGRRRDRGRDQARFEQRAVPPRRRKAVHAWPA